MTMRSTVDRRSPRTKALGLVALVLLMATNLLPVAWGALTSVKPDEKIVTYPPTVTGFSPTGDHYQEALEGSLSDALIASSGYAVLTVIAGLLIAALTAYALDRFEFPLRKVVYYTIAACIPLSIGAATLIIPTYLYFVTLGMIDHWYTLPLVYLGLNMPMSVWILKGSMEAVPKEIDEAAKIDGVSRMGILFRIILPLCKPGLVAAGLLIAIGAWNEFVAGSVMVHSSALQPVQLAIYQYISVFGREWGPLTASAILAVGPIVLLLVVAGRHFVSGMTNGSLKG